MIMGRIKCFRKNVRVDNVANQNSVYILYVENTTPTIQITRERASVCVLFENKQQTRQQQEKRKNSKNAILQFSVFYATTRSYAMISTRFICASFVERHSFAYNTRRFNA